MQLQAAGTIAFRKFGSDTTGGPFTGPFVDLESLDDEQLENLTDQDLLQLQD